MTGAAACECSGLHHQGRVVLTGGPGAGKTAVLELIRQSFCEHVKVLPEAASVVFGGGFPRLAEDGARMAAQRAIFYLQREMERAHESGGAAILLCDRGMLDGLAYWPGDPEELFQEARVSRQQLLQRYQAVIHLRTPSAALGYNHQNPLRVESAADAAKLDAAIVRAWEDHPRRVFIDSQPDFLAKARMALAAVRAELPECCRSHKVVGVDGAE